jgi:hypothetical protein
VTQHDDATRAAHWIEFAGIFYLIAAAFNLIAGVAYLSRDQFFDKAGLLVQSLSFWGWVFVIVGAVHVVVGVLILRCLKGARIAGIILAIVGMMSWWVAWGIYPWWALVMLVLYAGILYALIAFRPYFR